MSRELAAMLKRFLFLGLMVGMAWAKPVTTRFFEVTVPDTWEERPSPAAFYLLYPGRDVEDPEDANISISVSTISAGMSMDSLTFMGKHQVEQEYPEMVLATSTPTKVGKLTAHRFEYKGVRKGKKYEVVQVFAMQGNKSYTLEFVGSEADFNSVRGAFDQLLRSFKSL